MLSPDQRLFEEDVQSAPFRIGVAKRMWGQVEIHALPDGAAWPKAFFWMAAAPRPNAPDRFYVALDMSGYRSVPPTGTFWDPATKAMLDFGKRPKGKPGSRFAMVFHTAMIVPNFGNTGWWSLSAVGVHEYLGNFKWRTHPRSPSRRVKLSLW
jgi:hypothetical protein